MENTNNTPKTTISSFFNKRFKIFKHRLAKNIDMKFIILNLSLIPMAIVYFLCKGTKYGDGIAQAYTIPLETIYTIFNLIFNQSTVLELDSAKDILPCIFTVISMGLLTYVLIEAIKLFFALFVDGIEFLWKRKDTDNSFYNDIK